MQKEILIIFMVFLLFGMLLPAGLVIADDDDSSDNSDEDDDDNDDDDENSNSHTDDDDDRNKVKLKFEIKRTIVNEDGSISKIKIKIEEKIEDGVIKRKIKIKDETRGGEFEAKTELELKEVLRDGEKSIFAILSNGNESLINIMPDRIAEIALERLQSRNLTLELKEIKHKNVPKVVYYVEANKTGKFLGIFKMKLKIKAQIDPETGEFIGGVKKPWWAFLVVGEGSDQVGKKVTICHIPPGDPGAAHTISVGLPAQSAHLAHGDTLGACTDGNGNGDNETGDENQTEEDTESPQWFNSSTNSTINGTYIEHSVRWTDDTNLSGYIFSFDDGTGSFIDDDYVIFSGTENWSNVTKLVNSTANTTINWKVYANDTSGNWNETDVFSYNTTAA